MEKNRAMNIRETIISSCFIHLIIILLAVAAGRYTTDLSGNLKNIISVDLASDISNVLSPSAHDSTAEQVLAPIPTSDTKMTEPDESAVNPPEETKELSEPEKNTEPQPAPALSEKPAEIPAQKDGPANIEAYYQFLAVHKTLFRQQASGTVNQLLGEALKVNRREFYGGVGLVTVEYGVDGKVNKVFVDSESPELKAFLEEIGWGVLPSPSRYSLRNSVVRIEFSVLEGSMAFNVNAL